MAIVKPLRSGTRRRVCACNTCKAHTAARARSRGAHWQQPMDASATLGPFHRAMQDMSPRSSSKTPNKSKYRLIANAVVVIAVVLGLAVWSALCSQPAEDSSAVDRASVARRLDSAPPALRDTETAPHSARLLQLDEQTCSERIAEQFNCE